MPEENNNKDNNISVNALIIPLRRQFTKYVHEDARKICQGNKRYYTVEQGKNTEQQSNPKKRSKLCFFFLRFLGLTCKGPELSRATDIFVGHIELLNGFIRVVLVFRELLM